ncbi:MAG: hypothetical protein KC636_12745 [Myxococcales bacterium]|nr:hypothetical protein [Myxococcales bacterium]
MNLHSTAPLLVSLSLLGLACSINNGTTNDTGTGTNTGTAGTDATAGTDTTAGPTTDGGDTVTIPMLRMGQVTEGETVTVSGALVAAPFRIYGSMDQYAQLYLADPAGGQWSGIYLFTFADVAAELTLAVGDTVSVTGTYSEYNGVSQLEVDNAANIVATGQGTLPAPVVVAASTLADVASAEPYESVVVRVEAVDVIDDSLGFGNFELSGGLILNNQYLFEAGESFSPKGGDSFEALIGPLAVNSFQDPYFYIAPRDFDDIIGWDMGGGTTGTDTDPTDGEQVTIYELQQDMIPEDTLVEVVDVIVTTAPSFNKKNFWVQDPGGGEYSGINVYVPGTIDGLAPGDIVTIVGSYQEFYDNSQIVAQDPADVTKTGSGPAPTPEVVSAANIGTGGPLAENYEGVLVRVEEVDVVTAGVDPYWEWTITGDVTMDSDFFANADWPHPTQGAHYGSITGVLSWGFDARRLLPRSPADIVE